jgi:RNA polymerase sigma factor (sigma-70 family)
VLDLQELIETERDRAWRLALRVTGSPEAASDAVQEACVSLLTRGAPARIDSPRAWFLKAVVHTARNMQRGEQRRRAREERWTVDRNTDKQSSSPLADAANSELAAKVGNAMTSLEDGLRLPLELVYQEGLTHSEAATILDISRGAVGVYVQRGLEKLRAALMRSGTTLAPVVVIGGIRAVELPVPPAGFALAISSILSGAAAGKAVATTAVAATGGVMLAWKLLAGSLLAALLGLAGFGAYRWADRVPAAAAPARTGSGTKDPNAGELLVIRGSEANYAWELLRSRGLRVEFMVSSYKLIIPPAARRRPLRAEKMTEAIAEFNGCHVAWGPGRKSAVLYRRAADEEIRRLGDELKSPNAELRADAAWHASSVRDFRIIPLLLGAAADPNAEVSREARRSLRALGWASALALHREKAWPLAFADLTSADRITVPGNLVELLTSCATDKQLVSLQVLVRDEWPALAHLPRRAKLGTAALCKALSEALADDNPDRIRKALQQLPSRPGDTLVRTLGRAAIYRDKLIAIWAINILRRAATPEAIKNLRTAATDPRAKVRAEALTELARLGAPGTAGLISKALEQSSVGTRLQLLKAAGIVGGPDGLAILEKWRDARDWKYTRQHVLAALGEDGGPRALSLLEEALRSADPDVRRAAAKGLFRIGNQKAITSLREVIQDSNALTRARVVGGLYWVRSKAGLKLVSLAIKDRNDRVAGNALLCARDEALLPALERSAKRPGIAKEALEAIRVIGGRKAREVLERILENSTGYTRAVAAAELLQMRSTRGLKAAREIIATRNKYADTVTAALGRYGGLARFELIALAQKDDRKWVRSNALNGLRKSDAAKALPLLRRSLGHRDKYVRSNAVRRVGQVCGRAALPLLRTALKDKAGEVRKAAMDSLARIAGPEARALIERCLKDPDSSVRRRAVSTLKGIGDEASRRLLEIALKDKNKFVRTAAASGLCHYGDEKAQRFARQAMRSDDSAVRCGVVAALDRLPAGKRQRLLEVALVDNDRGVRQRAISSLKTLGGPEAILLLGRAAGDKDESLAPSAVRVLKGLGDDRALPVLETVMGDKRPLIRRYVVEGMRYFGGAKARNIVAKGLADPELSVRLAAARLVADLDDEKVLVIVKAAMGSEDKRMRRNAVLGLGQMRGAALKSLLVKASTDPDPYTRADAVGALASTGKNADRDVSERLIKALGDKHRYVRDKACWGLAWTGSRYPALREANRDALLKHFRAEANKHLRGRIKELLQMFYPGDQVVAKTLGKSLKPSKEKPEVF